MAGGLKSFGPSRFPRTEAVPSGPGPVFDPQGAQFVHLFGNAVEVGNEPAEVGVLYGNTDGVDLSGTFNQLNKLLATGSLLYGRRLGTADTIDRLISLASNGDAEAVQTLGFLGIMSHGQLFNGTAWDRARSGSAAALAAFSGIGAQISTSPGNWSINHVPAAATQATIARAAGAAGVRHVCTGIDGVLIIPPTVNQPAIQLNLRDGTTGAGTILFSRQCGIGAALAAGGMQEVSLSGLNIVGSAATAMTLEFSAAGAATTLQSVALTGYDAS